MLYQVAENSHAHLTANILAHGNQADAEDSDRLLRREIRPVFLLLGRLLLIFFLLFILVLFLLASLLLILQLSAQMAARRISRSPTFFLSSLLS